MRTTDEENECAVRLLVNIVMTMLNNNMRHIPYSGAWEHNKKIGEVLIEKNCFFCY